MPSALSTRTHQPAPNRGGDQQNVSRGSAAVVAGNATSSRTASFQVVVAEDVFSFRGSRITLGEAVAVLQNVDLQTLAVVEEAAQDLLLCVVSDASLDRGRGVQYSREGLASATSLLRLTFAVCISTSPVANALPTLPMWFHFSSMLSIKGVNFFPKQWAGLAMHWHRASVMGMRRAS